MAVFRCAIVCVSLMLIAGPAVAQPSPPLIGVTFTHAAIPGCDLGSNGIVLHYDRPGMRRLVRSELAAMHAAGIQTVRILLWNMSDITGQDWGVVPSAGGKIAEPYRSNLIRFASDVRSAGFVLLTVHFSPQWTNNPIGEYGPNGLTADRWDPTKFEENWSFVADVHKLVKEYGPDVTHFDFMSEGPPSQYQPAFIIDRMQNYIATMWTRYVAAFGKDDATVSIIAKGRPVDASDRLQHLIDALRPTGLGFPDWFEVHPDWTSPEVFNELQAVDDTLRANGLLAQPLVIGESSYENPAVAADIRRFMNTSSRPISEVYEWWQTTVGGPCVSAPYRADTYITTLSGAATPPPTPSPLPLVSVPKLSGSVSSTGKVTLKTASGGVVKTLDAGPYTILVQDRSKRYGFRLSGPDLQMSTSKRFVGRKVWHVEIGTGVPYGSVFRYGPDRGANTSFVVH
jgi:hypothetical protein